MLRVNKLKLSNAGGYTVKVSNGNLTKMENFTLIIRSAPSVAINVLNPQGLYNSGQLYKLKCSAEGFPMPTVKWMFKPCTAFHECTNSGTTYISNSLAKRHRNKNTYSRVSVLEEVARRSGQFICEACNSIICKYDKVDFFVTDVPDGGFSLDGPNNVLVGEAITLKCSASKYNFSSDSIEWYKDTLNGEKKLETSYRYQVDLVEDNSRFSFTMELRIMNVTLSDKGRYLCRVGSQMLDGSTSQQNNQQRQSSYQVSASRRRSQYDSHSNDDPSLDYENQLSFKLNVLPLEHPVLISSNLVSNSQIENQPLIIEQPEDGAELVCRVSGRPWPEIKWFLNGQKLRPTLNNSRVQIIDDNQVVRVSYVSAKDEGLYECEVKNQIGSIRVLRKMALRSTIETIQMYDQLSIPVIVAVVIAVFLVIILIVIAKLCYGRSKKANSSITSTTSTGCPWKDPPTPPTPKLTQFDMPMANTPSPPGSSQISQVRLLCKCWVLTIVIIIKLVSHKALTSLIALGRSNF